MTQTTQVVQHPQNLNEELRSSLSQSAQQLTLGEPRCIVISGTSATELTDLDLKNNFELLRERISGATVITFDELFSRVRQ